MACSLLKAELASRSGWGQVAPGKLWKNHFLAELVGFLLGGRANTVEWCLFWLSGGVFCLFVEGGGGGGG